MVKNPRKTKKENKKANKIPITINILDREEKENQIENYIYNRRRLKYVQHSTYPDIPLQLLCPVLQVSMI